ncbi:MAG TPA: T9SS type A sorting domain-containing protein, partial [Bacteroidetes bacterium]|nr:T9SS type A sorting domain-containing protein [Bacteroidota bacterium]
DNGYGLDQDGSSYVMVGSSNDPGVNTKILMMKANASGTVSGAFDVANSGNPNGSEWGFDIKTVSPNTYVIAGANRNSSGLTTPLLTVVSGTGSPSAGATYPSGNLNRAFNAVSTMSGNQVCAVGYTENLLTSGADLDGLLIVANSSNLNYIAGNSYGGVGDDVFNDVIELSNGNLLAVGSTESFGALGKGMYIVVVNQMGNKVWSHVLDSTRDDIAYAAVEDSFGIVIVGETNSFNPDGRFDPCLVRYQLNGTYLSTNVYENPNFQNGARGVDVIPGDGFIVSGRTMGSDSIAWLLRISEFFQPVWYQQYDGTALSDVLQNGGGSSFYAIGSHLAPGAMRSDVYFVKADNMGNTGSSCTPNTITVTSSVEAPFSDLPADTIVGAGNSATATMTGSSASITNYDACVFVGVSDEITSQVQIHPNPSTGQVTVSYAFAGVQEVKINIYDLQGRSVFASQMAPVSQGSSDLDLDALPAGVYLMRLRAGERSWTRKLILE